MGIDGLLLLRDCEECMLFLLKLYAGHISAWATAFMVRFLFKGGSFRVVDVVLISMIFAVFSAMVHFVFFIQAIH